jgi:HPt (histidine-containing phosphotransfer) domain-containing protein
MAQQVAKDARVGLDIAADAPSLAPAEPVIDRAHLTRMTHGESDLEREVLQLYATQAAVLLGRMLRADAVPLTSAAVAALAHTLKGSSRGVGAWQVADAAAAVEADAAEGRDTAASIERLASAIGAAQLHIVDLMRN